MRNKALVRKHIGSLLVFSVLVLGAGIVTEIAAQTKRVKPAPVAPVQKPDATVSTGSGVGGSTGSGIGGTTGAGTGSVKGGSVGAPTGSLIVAPSGNAAGGSSGNGTGKVTGAGTGTVNGSGTGTQSGEGAGASTGNGTGSNTGSSTGADAPVVFEKTYIKELSGRCFYVTNQGGKRYVARRNCALYP